MRRIWKAKRLILSLVTIWLLLSISSTFATEEFIDMDKDYNSSEINEKIEELSKLFPESVQVEILENSYDGKEIKALRVMNSGLNFEENKRYQDNVRNYLITAGMHGREPINPRLILKQLEYYLRNNLIPENVVIHAIPLVNPDGYDLALFGVNEVSEVGVKYLKDMSDTNYPRWKANIRGVDINRNFPDEYFDIESQSWIDFWGRADNKKYISNKPAGAYYFGDVEGSEIETQNIMNYISKYKFELLIDYHSMGKVIYHRRWFMPQEYNTYSTSIAKAISRNNNYYLMPPSDEHGSGFIGDYFANQYRKPALTIETTRTFNLPYLTSNEKNLAYKNNRDSTLIAINYDIENSNYGKYKTYDERGNFYTDFNYLSVANAYAKRLNLKVLEYEGVPNQYSDKVYNDFLKKKLMESERERLKTNNKLSTKYNKMNKNELIDLLITVIQTITNKNINEVLEEHQKNFNDIEN